MKLPPDFRFSQYSLQDYLDCPRRFLLRHVLRLAWPAEESQPVLEQEAKLALGSRFHQLAQQAAAGVPADLLAQQVAGEQPLEDWWRNFQQAGLPGSGGLRRAEHRLAATWQGFPLMAVYDLIAANENGEFTIYDWKTAERRPRRDALRQRIQTRLYPFLLCLAGASLNGGQPIAPETLRMVYWFPNFPAAPEVFDYNAEKQAANGRYLEGLLGEIAARQEDEFGLTAEQRRCTYCVFRSYCDRGLSAGNLEDQEDLDEADQEFSLDFEQIAEIAF